MNGMRFTTWDKDNDLLYVNCAAKYGGEWWFNSCSEVLPNGLYFGENGSGDCKGICWLSFANGERLKETRIMIR